MEDMQKIMSLFGNEEFVKKFKSIFEESSGDGEVAKLRKMLEEKEKELEKTKKFIEQIFSSVPKPLFFHFVDKDGKIRYVNNYTLEFYGKSLKEFIGSKPSELFKDPTGQKTLAEAGMKTVIETALEKGGIKIESVEARLTTEKGSVHIISSCAPVHVNGDFEGMVGFYVDVTPIKKREEEAKKAYEMVKEIIKAMPGYVIFVGEDGLVKYANYNITKLAGIENIEEAVGKKPNEIARIHESYKESAKKLLEAIKKKEKLENLELRLISATGEEVFVSASIYPLLVEGKFSGYIEVFNDITVIKEKEKELWEIIDKLPIAAFFMDPQHKIVYWNRACEELTGVKAEEVVGTDKAWTAFYTEKRAVLADLVLENPKEAEKYYKSITKSKSLENAYIAESQLDLPNGKRIFVRITASPVYIGRKLLGVVETLEDITELKRKEKEIEEMLSYTSKCLDSLSNGIRKLHGGEIGIR
ncbi:MAG: PAS domain-containing protein, partial [Archaeoglobaceae archaeon]|nr:PAS domain-containing protein [Archaeoglobaceae archaeon]